jgi:hypothetical protein
MYAVAHTLVRNLLNVFGMKYFCHVANNCLRVHRFKNFSYINSPNKVAFLEFLISKCMLLLTHW